MLKEKEALIKEMGSIIRRRIENVQKDIEITKQSRDGETKSSAGDKHETGRAMVQRELEAKSLQLANLREIEDDIGKIKTERDTTTAGFGSLVVANTGKFFLSVGIGKVEVDDMSYFVISMDSPIGALLKGKKAGDAVKFRNNKLSIIEIG